MIVPGSVNPLLLAMGGDPLDEYGKIDRSLRVRSSANGYLTMTPGSAATDGKKWTWSAWFKRGLLASSQMTLFSADNGAGESQGLYLHTDDSLRFSTGANLNRFSSSLYRDPGAHMHIVLAADSSQAVEADRLKLFVNGAQVLWSSSVAVALNAIWKIGAQSVLQGMGRSVGSVAVTWLDGYLSHPAFVDGQALTPSAFAGTHPRTGQWRPKWKAAVRAAVALGGGARNGWGANGFFLPFDDVTSLTTLNYDRSQSDTDTAGNNFTATNISLTAGTTYDALLDTPTNNFCTLNPLAWRNGTGQPTYSNGNLEVINPSGVFETYSLSTLPLFAGGETYFEATILASSTIYPIIGIADDRVLASVFTNTFGYLANGQKQINGVNSAYGASFTTNDVIGVRVNTVTNEIEFFKQTAGAGAFVSQGVIAINAGVTYFLYIDAANSAKAAVNFGQRAFNNPSPPATAKQLCTKNMPVIPKGGIIKPPSAFVAVADSGANIAASLAAARAGWPAYIDIIKRRDTTAEGWRWIFSDDAANYLDSSSTAAKAAVPAFGGATYVGYSLKVSATNGVATGRLSHTNGVADAVTDGLASTRKMVILKNEATGSWYVYHPDCTAGKLLYLEQNVAETTDSSISSVTASGFTAAAALPTGTYRWIAITELDGFSKIGKHVGNGSNDGPFDSGGGSPAFCLFKANAAGAFWAVIDQARSSANPATQDLWLDRTVVEGASIPAVDRVSNGVKIRSGASADNANYNGVATFFLMFMAFPFRYANAR